MNEPGGGAVCCICLARNTYLADLADCASRDCVDECTVKSWCPGFAM